MEYTFNFWRPVKCFEQIDKTDTTRPTQNDAESVFFNYLEVCSTNHHMRHQELHFCNQYGK